MNTIEYSCGHQVPAHSGQAMPMQCACGEGEIVGAKGQFYMSDEMSRSKRDAAMSAEPLQKPEWDGSDLPPVGTECEVEDFRHGWILATVIAHDNIDGVAVCKTFYGYDGYSNFRPIRTRAQTEREELIRIATQVLNHDDVLTERDAAEALYDAGMLRRAGE